MQLVTDRSTPMGAIMEKLPGYVKVSYCGLAKNTADLMMLFALSNLWMIRKLE